MERAVPALPGDDISVAKDFYVDGLGFQVSFEMTDDGKLGLLGLERGAISLTIDCPMPGHGRDACVSLQVENADAYYREWRNRVEIRARLSFRGPRARRASGRHQDREFPALA